MKRFSIRKELKILIIRFFFFLLVILLIWLGYSFGEATGFGPYTGLLDKDSRGKTLWDWLELLIIPTFLAGIAYYFNHQERNNEIRIAEERWTKETSVSEQRRQDSELQNYLDKMNDLIMNRNLQRVEKLRKIELFIDENLSEEQLKKRIPNELQPVKDMAHIRTMTIIRQLDKNRIDIVLNFLRDANLAHFILTGGTLMNIDLSAIDLRGINFDSTKFTGINFSNANLSKANLSRAELNKCKLIGTDLTGAKLVESKLNEVEMKEVCLIGTKLIRADMIGIKVDLANMVGADCSEAKLSGTIFRNCNMRNTNFNSSNLNGAELSEVDLTEANIKNADMYGVLLRNVTLNDAILSESNLTEADISGTIAKWAIFHRTLLQETYLERCVFNGSRFDYADLSGSDLSDSDLSDTTFQNSKLVRANFTNTNLFNVDFTRANLYQAYYFLVEQSQIDFREIENHYDKDKNDIDQHMNRLNNKAFNRDALFKFLLENKYIAYLTEDQLISAILKDTIMPDGTIRTN